MLTLFITANLLALTYGGDTFWDATNGECGLFTSTTPAIFIRDSGRCGVCPASTCHTVGDSNFSPRCFSLRDPLTDATANQALTAKCFDRVNGPACDVSSPSNQYFEWDLFPNHCRVDNLGNINNNGCPSCVDSNTPCDPTTPTTPVFVVQSAPSGTGGLCYISGCTANYVREFKQFQFQSGISLSHLTDAMTLHYIRDRCPGLSHCNDPSQWMMDVCGCPYCHVPTTTSVGQHTTNKPHTSIYDTASGQHTTRTDPHTTAGPHTTSGGQHTTNNAHTTSGGSHTTKTDTHTTAGPHTTGGGSHTTKLATSNPHTTRTDPHTTSGQHTTRSDPHTTKTDPHTTSKTDPHTTSGSHTTRNDPHTTSGSHTTRHDPHTTKSDSHTTKNDAHTTSNTDSHATRHTYPGTTSGDRSTTDDICTPNDVNDNCNGYAIDCHKDSKHNSVYSDFTDEQKNDRCAHCLCDIAFGNGHASYRCMYHALTAQGFNGLKNDNTPERLKGWFVGACFSADPNCQFSDVEIIVPVTGCGCGSFSCNGEVGVFDQGSANKYGYGIGVVISFLLYIIA